MIVKPDEIGDFVIWLGSAKELRNIFPHRQMILVANQAWLDLAQQFSYWDRVLPFEPRRFKWNPFYRLRLLARIRRLGADKAIHPVYSRNFLVGDSIVHTCGARERIGFQGDLSNILSYQKRVSDRWYTRLVETSSPVLSEIRRHGEFTRALGQSLFETCATAITLGQQIRPIDPLPKLYYVVIPGSYRLKRQWPYQNFVRLLDRIHESLGLSAVVCGGPREIPVAQKITTQTRSPILDFTGRTSLVQLAAVIRSSVFLVGNETSAVHLAASVGTRSVCILGGGHFGRFLPYDVPCADHAVSPECVFFPMTCYGCNWSCPYTSNQNETVPCIAQVSVEQVYEKIERLLIATNHPSSR